MAVPMNRAEVEPTPDRWAARTAAPEFAQLRRAPNQHSSFCNQTLFAARSPRPSSDRMVD